MTRRRSADLPAIVLWLPPTLACLGGPGVHSGAAAERLAPLRHGVSRRCQSVPLCHPALQRGGAPAACVPSQARTADRQTARDWGVLTDPEALPPVLLDSFPPVWFAFLQRVNHKTPVHSPARGPSCAPTPVPAGLRPWQRRVNPGPVWSLFARRRTQKDGGNPAPREPLRPDRNCGNWLGILNPAL